MLRTATRRLGGLGLMSLRQMLGSRVLLPAVCKHILPVWNACGSPHAANEPSRPTMLMAILGMTTMASLAALMSGSAECAPHTDAAANTHCGYNILHTTTLAFNQRVSNHA